jgi:serralysin
LARSASIGSADVIQIDDTIFADLSAVLTAATQVGADTVITYDANNTITLKKATQDQSPARRTPISSKVGIR